MEPDPEQAAAAVVDALRHLGIDAELQAGAVHLPATGHLLVARSAPAPTSTDGASIVVRPRIPAAERRRLVAAGAGYLDLSGHLAVRSGGLVIDADVPGMALPGTVQRSTSVLGGRVVAGITVSALVAWPEPLAGVRATARDLGATPGAVSMAIRRLVDAGLLTHDHRAVPDLFWTAASEWRPTWVTVAVDSIPGSAQAVEVGPLAASLLGAPVAVSEHNVPELLVPSPATIARAQLAGPSSAPGASRSARVTVAPSPAVLHTTDARLEGTGFPVAPLSIVALTLAIDPGRGAETVRGWTGDHVW